MLCNRLGVVELLWKLGNGIAGCFLLECVVWGAAVTGSSIIRPMWDKVFGTGRPTLTAWEAGQLYGGGKVSEISCVL